MDPLTILLLIVVVTIVVVVISLNKKAGVRKAAYEAWRVPAVAAGETDTSFAAYKRISTATYRAEALEERNRVKTMSLMSPEQRRVAAQAQQISEWQRAYELANGTPPPPGAAPAFMPSGANQRTNTMAILALIFGLGGGVLGIFFGHLALSQIAKSGETGRGLAITGLVFGYLYIVAILVIFLVARAQIYG